MSTGEPFELRGRKLISEVEQIKLNPGDNATLNRRQIRALQGAVRAARTEGRVTMEDARSELRTLARVLDHFVRIGRPVAIRLCAADREFNLRSKATAAQRNKRRAQKKARTAQRAPKKSKSRKRRQ